MSEPKIVHIGVGNYTPQTLAAELLGRSASLKGLLVVTIDEHDHHECSASEMTVGDLLYAATTAWKTALAQVLGPDPAMEPDPTA